MNNPPKGTSIGIELVGLPSVLFLDEPTSGLDSYSARSLVADLGVISKGGESRATGGGLICHYYLFLLTLVFSCFSTQD